MRANTLINESIEVDGNKSELVDKVIEIADNSTIVE